MSTIKDVARLAGVSASTVSRALSGRVFVEEETRQRVLRAVEELHYRPSMTAKALKEGRSRTLAFFVPDINSLFYPMIMKSIERYAAEMGYTVILCNNEEDVECETRNMDMAASRGIDGMICMSVEDDAAHYLEFHREYRIPVVFINRSLEENVSCISIDNVHGAYLATKYLLDKGHKKIAAMFGDPGQKRYRERYMGYEKAMKEYGIPVEEKYVVHGVKTIEEALIQAQKLLPGEKPTAVFASMDILAIGIYSAAYELGMKIPEDISVVGFDNIFMAQYMTPPLTTYNAPIDRLAKESVECLIRQIKKQGQAVKKVLKGELLERNSVRTLTEF